MKLFSEQEHFNQLSDPGSKQGQDNIIVFNNGPKLILETCAYFLIKYPQNPKTACWKCLEFHHIVLQFI